MWLDRLTRHTIEERLNLEWRESLQKISRETNDAFDNTLALHRRRVQEGQGSEPLIELARLAREEIRQLLSERKRVMRELMLRYPFYALDLHSVEADMQSAVNQWVRERVPTLSDAFTRLSYAAGPDKVDEVVADAREIARAEFEQVTLRRRQTGEPAGETDAAASSPDASASDPQVLRSLGGLDPRLAASYEQVVRDLSDLGRRSYLGPVAEIREVFSGAIRGLAPEEQVQEWLREQGEKPETKEGKPSRQQRIRFILFRQTRSARSVEAVRRVSELLDDTLPSLMAHWYGRASDGAHTGSDREEAIRVFTYAEAFLRDLLPAGRGQESEDGPEQT